MSFHFPKTHTDTHAKNLLILLESKISDGGRLVFVTKRMKTITTHPL